MVLLGDWWRRVLLWSGVGLVKGLDNYMFRWGYRWCRCLDEGIDDVGV